MRKESFLTAKTEIVNYLYKDHLLAYTTFDILSIFNQMKPVWNIAEYRTPRHFTNFLKNENILIEKTLKKQNESRIKHIYREPNATNFDVALTIKKDGHLSNYTAMQIHQLTLQIPKTIYVSYEKSGYSYNDTGLEQTSIDSAFSKPQRITSDIYRSEDDNIRFYFIQKAFTKKDVGIITKDGYQYTDLERTLIDIAVRPAYSGGVFEVLEAFERAKEIVDIEKINKYLIDLAYIYPYHQLIGFYMDKAGYDEHLIDNVFLRDITYNFYLTYNMSNKEFNSKWKIFYPKGF